MQDSTFIGQDGQKATISIAVAHGERGCEVRYWRTIPHRPDHIQKLAEKLVANGSRLHFTLRPYLTAMTCIAKDLECAITIRRSSMISARQTSLCGLLRLMIKDKLSSVGGAKGKCRNVLCAEYGISGCRWEPCVR